MIFLFKAELIMHYSLPLKVKLVAKFFVKIMSKQTFTSFQLTLNPLLIKLYPLLHPVSWSNMLKMKFSKQVLILVL